MMIEKFHVSTVEKISRMEVEGSGDVCPKACVVVKNVSIFFVICKMVPAILQEKVPRRIAGIVLRL